MNPALWIFLIFAVAAVAASAGFAWGVLMATRPPTPRAPGDDGCTESLVAGNWTETGTKRVISLVPTGPLKSGPNVMIPPVYPRAAK